MSVNLTIGDYANVVRMNELKDGQIAIVVDERYPQYKGYIVQRYGRHAVVLGSENGQGWGSIENVTLKVRILQSGEKLTVANNQ
jgi:hypothetical protein